MFRDPGITGPHRLKKWKDRRALVPGGQFVHVQGAALHLAGGDLATASRRGRPSPLGSPAHWPGRMKRCPACWARGWTAMRSSPAQISNVPWRCPTWTMRDPPTSSGPRSAIPPS